MDGYIFRKLRIEKRLTLLEVYVETGVNPATINKIENGKNKKPSHATIQALCKFFGLDQNLI